jgi:hypothetical protein
MNEIWNRREIIEKERRRGIGKKLLVWNIHTPERSFKKILILIS